MRMNRFVTIGGAVLDTLVTGETLFSAEVSRPVLLLGMVLFAAEALLGVATVRHHHLKATNPTSIKLARRTYRRVSCYLRYRNRPRRSPSGKIPL